MEDANKIDEPRINLFENIALAFSGGGYRASSFGLGVLSYLKQVQFKDKSLLEHVKGLSTVSGGTLMGATYACYMAKGERFETFYDNFYKVLDDDRLLGVALEKLDSDELWKASHKRRSLINAFALAYHDLLTKENFKFLKQNKSHLEDICFNATDFSFGLAFRFQTTGRFGNYRLYNSHLKQLADDMKIADAIASSSCFPIGFEPLLMPDDYVSDHNSETYKAIKAKDEFKKGVGIMDGGIVDNQGIGSIMNAEVRRVNDGKSYDLIMVCDVGSYFMEAWEASEIEMDRIGWSKSPKQLFNLLVEKLKLSWWLWLPLIVSFGLLISGFMNRPSVGLFIGGGAMAMFALFAVALKYFIGKMEEKSLRLWAWMMGIVPKFMKDKLIRFQNLKLRLIQRMIEERGTSSFKMISDIFLKQIRRLNYDLLYKDDSLKNRRITSLIYELTKDQYQKGDSDEKEMDIKEDLIKDPSELIFNSAQIACEMDTTLWFTEKDRDLERLKNLVACGQYTACYNLLKYCIDLKKAKANVDPELLNEMIDIFLTDWNEFVKDPYYLHDHYQQEKDEMRNVG
ncbi:patatin-like phospholipase family protein [Ancylomarina sp. DW003]|nr:patatin-like phospholipase family protein [Ancylomarina sp. DW003]MDE5422879.1 patatin-like phospholipase family protein [Ancylomarina sp. DW003]